MLVLLTISKGALINIIKVSLSLLKLIIPTLLFIQNLFLIEYRQEIMKSFSKLNQTRRS